MLISKPHYISIGFRSNCGILFAFAKYFTVVRKIGGHSPANLYGRLFEPPIRYAKCDRYSICANTAAEPNIQITVTDTMPFSTAVGTSALLLRIDVSQLQLIGCDLG